MPQLNNFQRQDLIWRRIDKLEKGFEVAARDIDNLLTTEELGHPGLVRRKMPV